MHTQMTCLVYDYFPGEYEINKMPGTTRRQVSPPQVLLTWQKNMVSH